MPEIGRGSQETLKILFKQGIRYSTCIDVGCADGHFYLIGHSQGYFQSAAPFHVDPNPIYEGSLKAIKDIIGGNYTLCAASDFDGEIEITFSENPYWSSARQNGDIYWQRIGTSAGKQTNVPAFTLDTLAKNNRLRPPFFLRLDVQGSELNALKGAKELLKQTHVILCECDIMDFSSINTFLSRNKFHFYDMPNLHYVDGDKLGWFYAVYVSDEISHVLPNGFWNSQETSSIIQLQLNQRQKILDANANYLRQVKEKFISRNNPCPCGSGKKYKHCHGS